MTVDTFGLNPMIVRQLESLEESRKLALETNATSDTADKLVAAAPDSLQDGRAYWNYGHHVMISWFIKDAQLAVPESHKLLLNRGYHLAPDNWQHEPPLVRVFKHKHLESWITVRLQLAADATCEMVQVGTEEVPIMELQCDGEPIKNGETVTIPSVPILEPV